MKDIRTVAPEHTAVRVALKKEGEEIDMVHLNDNLKISWCLEVKWSDRYPNHTGELESLIKFCEYQGLSQFTVTTQTISKFSKVSEKVNIDFREAALICFNIGNNILSRDS